MGWKQEGRAQPCLAGSDAETSLQMLPREMRWKKRRHKCFRYLLALREVETLEVERVKRLKMLQSTDRRLERIVASVMIGSKRRGTWGGEGEFALHQEEEGAPQISQYIRFNLP